MIDRWLFSFMKKYKYYIVFALIAILVALADSFPLLLSERFKADLFQNDYNILVEGVLDQSLGGPFIYRLLIPYLVNFIHEILHIGMSDIGYYLNVLFSFISFILMFLIVKRLRGEVQALMAVFLLAIYIIYTQAHFVGIIAVETQDILNIVVMLGSFYLMIIKKYWISILVLLIGILNRETPLFMLLPFVYYTWKERTKLQLIVGPILCIGLYSVIRYLVEDSTSSGSWVLFETFEKNMPFVNDKYWDLAIESNWHLIVYIAPLLFFLFKQIDDRKEVFTPIKIMLIIFVIAHYFVGDINEIRLFLPVAALLIPFATYEFTHKSSQS